MNEVLDRIIKQSGEMWEAARPRQDSPVLVKLANGAGNVYELTLPKGEGHPFWRVNERGLTPDEAEEFFHSTRSSKGPEWEMGGLAPMGDGVYMHTRAFIYNGRWENRWMPSVERVRVQIERVD